jgi:hypothetical protein
MTPSAWHVRLSRRVNALRGGDLDTMLCAALHQEGSRWCVVIDVALAWRHWPHCRLMAEYERSRRTVLPDDVFRLFEGR